jgi:EAL domain-containing protein (putative c-di-GMP-specific phosphodiesterase class I)
MTGRTVELDRACLEVVIAGAHNLPDDVYISLNISPRSFEAPEFSAAAFLAILRRYRMAPGRVILELTERDVIRDLDRLRNALDECRRAGVQIAADDVGAGNAGLRLLSQIQFDVMKIDLSLVQASAGREPLTSVLRTLVDLANRWRALVVAEGVETPEQLRVIRSLGITAAQGYLLGRPGPVLHQERIDLDALAASDTAWWTRTGRAELAAR